MIQIRMMRIELVEMMVVMGKDRMIQLPEEEVRVMGPKEGEELCLSYLVDDWMEGKMNEASEFLVEKGDPSRFSLPMFFSDKIMI